MRTIHRLSLVSALAVIVCLAFVGLAQDAPKKESGVKEIAELELQIQQLQDKLKGLKEAKESEKVVADGTSNLEKLLNWRCIGPANVGGRMTALAAVNGDPSCYYAATEIGRAHV